MNIVVIIVTCHRKNLLNRALLSVKNQDKMPLEVYVISNSDKKSILEEERLCHSFGYTFFQNKRTDNYAGALNYGIEQIIENCPITDNLYFASLDDDDEWQPNYLSTLVNIHQGEDILFANITRINEDEVKQLQLPQKLSYHDFLSRNPGVGGSNTFVRLKTLLQAGTFDEHMNATVDRDIFIRLFQLNPTYRISPKHLVNLYVDKNRTRVTTNLELKKSSYQYFYYKYQYLMTEADKALFFKRAKAYFSIEKEAIQINYPKLQTINTNDIQFNQKGDYQFIVGFIAGDKIIAQRIINAIEERNISVDLLLIVNNLPNNEDLNNRIESQTAIRIISQKEWTENLQNHSYGTYFSKFNKINSIPIGRTILQYHLYDETQQFKTPIYWIIDDDVSFYNTSLGKANNTVFDIFDIINTHKDKADALIGSVSQDPPLPFFSCMRGQLVDLLYSHISNNDLQTDYKNVRQLPDYYYDITDAQTRHIETPIYYKANLEQDLINCFSGKAVSRPCFQKELKGVQKIVSNRGPNTLVFNRDILRSYPVVNLEVNQKFVRRGDLSWALMNQVFSNYTFIEHSMCLSQNRPITSFNIERELDKSANDIIGYAFNKALLKTTAAIKKNIAINQPKDILNAFYQEQYKAIFYTVFQRFLKKRNARFLMNYYRIMGVLLVLNQKDKTTTNQYLNQFKEATLNEKYHQTLEKALNKKVLFQYLENLGDILGSYNKALTAKVERVSLDRQRIQQAFQLKIDLSFLGKGSEGIVFTDKQFVYKSYATFNDNKWDFLKVKAKSFHKCSVLEHLDFRLFKDRKFIRYPYHKFTSVCVVNKDDLFNFLQFCYQHQLVYTNIKPSNFISIKEGRLKLIDYGKSFEPYSEAKFINSIKRACLFLEQPTLNEVEFKQLIKKINAGDNIPAIKTWKALWTQITQKVSTPY